MLVHRREDQVLHQFFNSAVGVSDWIVRNNAGAPELQVASAFQNYGLLMRLTSSGECSLTPSAVPADFNESKEFLSDGRLRHRLAGVYILECPAAMELKLRSLFLEGMRSIRILQEGGADEYAGTMGIHPPVEILEFSGGGGRVTFRREGPGGLLYRGELMFEDPLGITEAQNVEGMGGFSIQAGVHRLRMRISLEGRLVDEDCGAFAEDPSCLLKPGLAALLERRSEKGPESVRRQLEALSLLCRKGKYLAGGPRFFTYFGRDSLISTAILTGVVPAELASLAFASVLSRLSPEGEVAHEETLGEFAAISRMLGGRTPSLEPLLDYHMVDDDFLLTAVMGRWLEVEGPDLLRDILAAGYRDGSGAELSGYELLGRNIRFCYRRLKQGLIAYHPQVPVGDWRDSLAHQRIAYSYEVNLGLAPHFIPLARGLARALPELAGTMPPGLLGSESLSVQEDFAQRTNGFLVSIDQELLHSRVSEWLLNSSFTDAERTVLLARLETALPASDPYRFYALGLDGEGRAIEVQHNDIAFSLLFCEPGPWELDIMLRPLETAFPLGLRTGVGILVSNPVFAGGGNIRFDLNRSHYHGLVIWPLMHHLLYQGIQRQLKRMAGADGNLVLRLEALRTYLAGLPRKLGDFDASELWTFTPSGSGDMPLAFGMNTGSSTESNPVQLWSSIGFTTALGELLD